MKQIFLFAGWLLAVSAGFSQGFSSAEYYFDFDPGSGNGTSISLSSSSDSVIFTSSIPTASLSTGFHFLVIRSLHSGVWSLSEPRGFYISEATADVTDIVAAEYFIDTDPGAGNANPLNIGTSGSSANFVASIPTTSLSPGFHFLAIRSKDANNKWGLIENRGFYISQVSAEAADIVAAEYFIDTDPGAGNGNSLNIGTSGSSANFVASIPTTTLSPGFHFLAFRTKDAENKWGLVENRGFYVSTITTDAADIVAAEYFIDTDPGAGAGITLNLGPTGDTASFTVPVPTTSLAPGFHFLAIRAKDAEGKWGLFDTRGFYVSQAATDAGDIESAEYFFDNDPGVGKGEPLTVSSPGPDASQVFSIPIPSGFAGGSHLLAIRFKNTDRTWGLFEIDSVNVSTTLPVTGLLFTAVKQNNTAKLSWTTTTEAKTDRYEIERSRNGITFEKIAYLPASGNSTNQENYSYTDPQSGTDFIYYRIKQVDKNGHFVYSPIRMIRFNEKYFYTVYPTITSKAITINGITEKVNIKLFNTNGQYMKTVVAYNSPTSIDISGFAAGAYWLIIDKNGQMQHTQKVIKH